MLVVSRLLAYVDVGENLVRKLRQSRGDAAARRREVVVQNVFVVLLKLMQENVHVLRLRPRRVPTEVDGLDIDVLLGAGRWLTW